MHVITASRKDSLFRKARVALGALLLTLAGGVLAGERLHIFTEHYPPYNASTSGEEFAHSADEITGICTDMVKAILARTDFDYVMKVRAWSYVFDRVQGRPNHGLFCTARTEDREDLFQWVGPLASIKWTLFAAPDSDLTLERLEDARPLRIAGYKGDVMSQYLVDQGFNVIMSLSGDLNPQRLVLGQADLWVTDGLVGPLVARETQGIEGLRPVLVFRETPMYLAMSKETDPAIVAKLQNALDAARAAGELDAIQARYE
ncbi:ABC transporter substrate-binding protein [Marinobacter lutaoensis]|jgi:polar amino acid transport system substrate-binding protein|uniref:Amino acid ABC transporter substrate-binding protein n=1 Tax=Marinobacter lutaoensis TaxID=135739 RepID=A0A1V2DQS9_9GAMM|nr:ABC transporter substrate-binding protein [Marinobacter lutaoensis]MBE03259.1 amino acid ABC transporter substrate-binding protein [Marinobacter sp.]MBI44210.1 amino acid ABC transporter substrate-binding protein [Oceanospirillales bacterium]NVD36160.1 ABC transporter substrate-binding protein [Marinobacter lutaoensis]ONF43015.1 amino acid ABC transporter substrate-binding protein [Marinobacter lutaoensis]|tara:strand:+ start:1037 stop:1816 length:780 start_codon:yes stop_codon:yes gene_type:complete